MHKKSYQGLAENIQKGGLVLRDPLLRPSVRKNPINILI